MNGNIEMLPTPTPFRQFVAQSQLRISPAEQTRFFTEMLGDIDEATFPFGLSDVDRDGAEINDAHLELAQILNDQLRMHARNLQVSVASICHLAWAQVISKASGRESVVFGTVLLGRLQTGDENINIMGPMINTLPIRLDIDDRCVDIAVRHTHDRLSALLAYEHASLVLVQRCSNVPSDSPLFSALFNYRHNQAAERMNVSLLGVIDVDGEERTNYPLSLSVEDSGSSLGLSVEVSPAISAEQICAYMEQALKSTADALTQTPQQPVRLLNVIPPGERSVLLHGWNQTTFTHAPVCCLHQLLETQVQCDGQAIAVECNGNALSYSELNTQANQLAHYLITRGVKPDDRIALCVERSTTMIVAMLGILKAGCAYVPLDPVYTSQRLTDILSDANPIFLLADVTGREELGNHHIPVIRVEEPLHNELPIDNPDTFKLELTPAYLAYVIHTSGSTGTPKGVMVEHQQVVQYLELIHGIFRSEKQDKWSLFHSFSFDFSVWEIWGALSRGGQLLIVPYSITSSANEFYEWICFNGINMLGQTPSAFKNLLCAENIIMRPDQLLYIIVGGEELNPAIVREWCENYDDGKTVLANTYGPTETLVDATIWICDGKMVKNSIIPIGRPLTNKRIYLLDSYGQPVPMGAEGEIFIGGSGVARGYLNRSEFTAERFLPDPFIEISGARMYRTGDLARYLPDGNLVYLGRADQQVKIRGFRIELGEIEARLVEHPQVREAVVQLCGSGSDARLVAYVVANEDASIAQNLRTHLSTRLPDYMVPVAYVCLSSVPLTPSGKVDRRALPAPGEESFARQQYEAPLGELEEKLAQIWRELLNIERVSRHDNFFALGGHSLLVVRLLAHLRRIGLNTSVQEIFNVSTLATLSRTLSSYNAIRIPPNLITEDSIEITPKMLPLINLSQTDIDAIVKQVPGGVANIQDIYGLTPLQNGMLYHHLKTKERDPYLLVSRLRFIDRTSLERFADAIQVVVKRHDILRTAIFWDGLSEPAQVVLRQVPSILTKMTLDGSDECILEQLNQKFGPRYHRLDVTQAPLLSLIAAPTSSGSWVALQLTHHAITDHSTDMRLKEEINAVIVGKIKNPCTPTPFRQFVAHVRLGFSSAEYTQFFSELLGDVDEPTFPFGLNDVDQDVAEINEAQLGLSQTLIDQLRMHGRNLQVSVASICHLAWAQILAKASVRETVVFGTVVLGRLQAGGESTTVMGPMINTLPIRLDIDDRSVEIAVCQTHARLSALLTYEHAPLVLAQRCSGIPNSLPLFSALLNYRRHGNIEDSSRSLPGVSFIADDGQTNYPLVISFDDDDKDSCLYVSVQVLAPISATRICAHMQKALESLSDALTHTPKQSIRKLNVIRQEERTLLLHSWSQITATQSNICCLHRLFEAQVKRNGEAIAVECNGEMLSYSELNAQANHLAHYLVGKGVKPDDRIALCIERSITLIVAMLGILKAGGAYVPLDPVYTSQRLTNILLDSNPIFLLADVAGREALGNHQVPVIDLENPLPADLPVDNLHAATLGLTPAHLAYVIYTSGSTGTPKGVMVQHQQIVRLFEATHHNFGFNKRDKWCSFHSISFDFSVWEMWGALRYGSQLSIVSHDTARSTEQFYDWICANDITILNQTPSAFKMLLRVLNINSRSDRLRFIILGGEELDATTATDWFHKYEKSQTILVNMYGITEITVHATCQRFETTESAQSIGRPVADLRFYLLDSFGEPVLLGAEGEIYIGGAGVARGYLNRCELTAERFLLDPFTSDPSARMYRTGDLARYLPDGNLIFLGRADQQVKIRGFRIELGEIEARLVEHPQVHEAAVQFYGNGFDAHLVAYVIADEDTCLVQSLRTHLLNSLPDYMVPAAYIRLLSLPLTPSGKLDRRALPVPDDSAFARQQYEAPQGEIEQKLADIWRELLNVGRVSRHDNFFELGGHSLLVMHLVNKAKLHDMHFDGRAVFSFPILNRLAERIASQSRRMICDAAIPIRQFGNETPLFLLPDGYGDTSYAFELAHHIDSNIPVYVLPWSSPENKYPASIEEMASAMIPLIKTVRSNGPCTVAGYSAGGILAFEITKQLLHTGHAVSFLGLIDTHAPETFDPLSETEMLLTSLRHKFSTFKTIDDSVWWNTVSKLSFNEAVEEIKKINVGLNHKVDSNHIDIDWEALLSKQQYNYQNICAAYKIDNLPIAIHFFEALDRQSEDILEKCVENNEKLPVHPIFGWENCNLSTKFNVTSIDGDHYTMMTDPKNRSLLGKKLTECICDRTIQQTV